MRHAAILVLLLAATIAICLLTPPARPVKPASHEFPDFVGLWEELALLKCSSVRCSKVYLFRESRKQLQCEECSSSLHPYIHNLPQSLETSYAMADAYYRLNNGARDNLVIVRRISANCAAIEDALLGILEFAPELKAIGLGRSQLGTNCFFGKSYATGSSSRMYWKVAYNALIEGIDEPPTCILIYTAVAPTARERDRHELEWFISTLLEKMTGSGRRRTI